MKPGQSHRWGVTGFGVPFSRVLFAGGDVTAAQGMTVAERLEAARGSLDEESPHFTLMKEGLGYRNLMNSVMKPQWLQHGALKALKAMPPTELNEQATMSLENQRLSSENRRLMAEVAELRANL